jgi:hypothetical protein
MNRIVVALAALLASAIFVPAAQADCSDPDDASDVAACIRSIVKVPPLRTTLPPAAMPSAAMKERCDADDAEELKECLRALKAPAARQIVPPAVRPKAEVPGPPDRAEAEPAAATIASSEKPAPRGESDATPLCQKYFPNVGKVVSVPCSE